jgi:hypothetical protein
VANTVVVCVKFCKGGHGWLESCGLAELNFLVLFEIVHIEIAVGCEPVLVGLDQLAALSPAYPIKRQPSAERTQAPSVYTGRGTPPLIRKRIVENSFRK